MKKTILILGLLAALTAVNSYAFEIYNKTNADVYAVSEGNTWGLFDFGITSAGGTSKSWLPSSLNLPATVYVCWTANNGCSSTNIMTSGNTAQTQQRQRHGYVCVTGAYAPNTAPTLQADQQNC